MCLLFKLNGADGISAHLEKEMKDFKDFEMVVFEKNGVAHVSIDQVLRKLGYTDQTGYFDILRWCSKGDFSFIPINNVIRYLVMLEQRQAQDGEPDELQKNATFLLDVVIPNLYAQNCVKQQLDAIRNLEKSMSKTRACMEEYMSSLLLVEQYKGYSTVKNYKPDAAPTDDREIAIMCREQGIAYGTLPAADGTAECVFPVELLVRYFYKTPFDDPEPEQDSGACDAQYKTPFDDPEPEQDSGTCETDDAVDSDFPSEMTINNIVELLNISPDACLKSEILSRMIIKCGERPHSFDCLYPTYILKTTLAVAVGNIVNRVYMKALVSDIRPYYSIQEFVSLFSIEYDDNLREQLEDWVRTGITYFEAASSKAAVCNGMFHSELLLQAVIQYYLSVASTVSVMT